MSAYSLFLCPSSLRFISHGISHCYSSFRGDVRGTASSFYWTYLLSVCAGGSAWLSLWVTVDRCGRRGILLLSMTMTGLASLILLGLMECKWALVGSRTFAWFQHINLESNRERYECSFPLYLTRNDPLLFKKGLKSFFL